MIKKNWKNANIPGEITYSSMDYSEKAKKTDSSYFANWEVVTTLPQSRKCMESLKKSPCKSVIK